MMIQTWAEVTIEALFHLWEGFVAFIPALIGAIVVFIIGWFIAIGVGRLVAEILKKLRFDRIFERGVWKEALNKAEFKINASGFIGAIFKWILIIVFLYAAVGILRWEAFGQILGGIIAYLPNVVVAALIFVVTVIVADIMAKVVRAAVESVRVGYGHLVSAIVKWSIWTFAILAILHQLGIARAFMEMLFAGLVAMLVISFGIAFGLGGKEVAAEILQDLKKKLKG